MGKPGEGAKKHVKQNWSVAQGAENNVDTRLEYPFQWKKLKLFTDRWQRKQKMPKSLHLF